MITEFLQATEETRQIIARKRATERTRHLATADRLETSLHVCLDRLQDTPDELQRMIAYQIQHHNGGFLHMSSIDSAWHLIDAYAAGDRCHDQPMSYQSLV